MFKMMWACGFVLVMLLPQFPSTAVIHLDEFIDIDMENEFFPRDSVEPCSKEETVDLSNMREPMRWPHRIKSDKIRHVDLSFNHIENITNSFFRDVPNIECLNLTSNAYPPRTVLNGTNSDSLKTLILDRFDFLPWRDSDPCRITGYFPNLESLHLNEVRRCSMDESFEKNLPKLTTLYMMNYSSDRGEHINGRIPATVRHLHLERTRFDGLYNNVLRNLQSLYLDGYEYHDSLNISTDAINLQILSCRQCSLDLSAIDRFFNDPRNALKLLDLSDNDLSYLPEEMFHQANNLENLLLSNNLFTKIPNVENMPRLRGLVLSHNRIHQVADIKSDSLKMLSLRGNNISEISNTTFQELPAIEVLDLSENKLTHMPDAWASGLKNLVTLNFNSNLFWRLSYTSLTTATSNLSHLHMTRNPIVLLFLEEILLLPDNCTIHVPNGELMKSRMMTKHGPVIYFPTRFRKCN
ncbi:keratocan-like [Halictus rubicundus]|uniref:keratocan-like n=1 Tax=Halictus rubicundus TaxID=77578 RepID=UPI004035E4EE